MIEPRYVGFLPGAHAIERYGAGDLVAAALLAVP